LLSINRSTLPITLAIIPDAPVGVAATAGSVTSNASMAMSAALNAWLSTFTTAEVGAV